MSADTTATQADVTRVECHLKELMAANDKRYEQRFIDSQTAVAAALQASEKQGAAAMAAAEKAVQKAEMASEKRFEGVNEFRAALNDNQRNLMPRSEAEMRSTALEARIDALEKSNIAGRGQRLGMAQLWGYIIGGLGIGLALLSYARR